jgi:superfamily II DNA or RNA helicase
MEQHNVVLITFELGTLILEFPEKLPDPLFGIVVYDKRIQKYRAQAFHYGTIVLYLHKNSIPYIDNAKEFIKLNDLPPNLLFSPRSHQENAFNNWYGNGGAGVAILPTGAGKSFLAVMAIHKIKRSTLILVPTIDLMQQWTSMLEKHLGITVGMIGGGSKEIKDITVSTYDSAVIHMEFIGNKFGFIIFDECHHLPAKVYQTAAKMCIAPYRLGLTATPEREDEGENDLYRLVGPIIYQIHIDQLKKNVLAPYETRKIYVPLTDEELLEYKTARKEYTDFIKLNSIDMSQKDGWKNFIFEASRRKDGKKAIKSYLTQKNIANSNRKKIEVIWGLIKQHHTERIIIFTADNTTAYKIGKLFFLPVITHHTKAKERKLFLERFKAAKYRVIVTSKVLNEGVDVPEASIGIVVSGSGSIREHVQRLGRILRASEEKKAILYEVISEGTAEENVSSRRRNHRAYYNK